MPSATPQKDEIAISGAGDSQATKCASYEAGMQRRLKLTLLKVVVTKSPGWGTIWRADTAFPIKKAGERPIVFRTTCWKGSIEERPLEMFDPKASIPPLR